MEYERNVKKMSKNDNRIRTFETIMKKISLIIVVLGILVTSCQSEYGERMKKALQLKKEYQKVHLHIQNSKNPNLITQLSAIRKEIRFHATISGNEQLFLEEIWDN